jgi:hypothetical protein
MSRDARVMSFAYRHRRAIVWLCMTAALLAGIRAQLHALSHALQAVQTAAPREALAAHAPACEQCLQFAALDGAAPAHCAGLASPASVASQCGTPVAPQRAAVFAAYVARAPPRLG